MYYIFWNTTDWSVITYFQYYIKCLSSAWKYSSDVLICSSQAPVFVFIIDIKVHNRTNLPYYTSPNFDYALVGMLYYPFEPKVFS
jgi:hypothetical protein